MTELSLLDRLDAIRRSRVSKSDSYRLYTVGTNAEVGYVTVDDNSVVVTAPENVIGVAPGMTLDEIKRTYKVEEVEDVEASIGTEDNAPVDGSDAAKIGEAVGVAMRAAVDQGPTESASDIPSADTLFPATVPDPPRTGDPAVDKALADFAVAMCGDISGHPEAGEAIERALQSRLHDLAPE